MSTKPFDIPAATHPLTAFPTIVSDIKAATTLRPVPPCLRDAPSFMVAHSTDAFEVFKVFVSDVVAAKRILIEKGLIAREAAVVALHEVRDLRRVGASSAAVIRELIGPAPGPNEFDDMAQFNRALAYYDRQEAAVCKAFAL